jgi:hypothetical protein
MDDRIFAQCWQRTADCCDAAYHYLIKNPSWRAQLQFLLRFGNVIQPLAGSRNAI